ncbi:MAG: hypothetical protein SchgKO_10310 [Schleiferiaceae bacterium]
MRILKYTANIARITALLAVVLTGMTSCQDVVDLELPDDDPIIIINGRISDTKGVFIDVLASAPYFSNDSVPTINNAMVSLYQNNVLVGTVPEIPGRPGRYASPFNGTEGNTYYIRVDIPNSDPYFPGTSWESAPETMNRVFPIDSMYPKYLPADPPFQDEGYYIFMHFTETPGKGDNYRLKLWRNDSLQGRPQDLTVFDDEFIDGLSFNDSSQFGAFQLTGSPSVEGWTYRAELSSINLGYLDYITLLRQQTLQVGSTFDPPPAPIVGNIYEAGNPKNFGLGYFAVSMLSSDSTVVEK